MSNYLDINVSNDSFDNKSQKNENYDFLNDLVNLDNVNKKTDDKNKLEKLGSVQNTHIQQINSPIEDIDIKNKNTQHSKKSENNVQSIKDNQQKYVHENQQNSDEQIQSNEFANDFGISKDTKQENQKNENNELLQNIEKTNNLALQRNEFNDEDDQYDDENYEDDFETNTNNASKMNSSPNKFDESSNKNQDKQEGNIFHKKNQNGKDLQDSKLKNSLISNKSNKKIQKDNLLDVQDISEIKVEKINESSYDQNLENQNQKLQLLQNLKQANHSSLEKQPDILNKHPLRKVMTNQEKILLEKRQQQKQESLNFQESQMGIEQQHSIKVMARVRPLVQIEKHSDIVLEVNKDQNTLNFIDKGIIKEMKFWKTFNPQSKQQDVFNNLKNNIKDVLNGFNFTILAYGQTGSGKTYSMFGADWEQVFQSYLHQNQQKEQKSNKNFIKQQMTLLENTSEDENFTGIMPRSIALLFDELNNIQKIGSQTYNVYCSFFQIYNEKIYDLLNENRDPLQIRTSALDGLFIDGLTEFKSENYINTIQIMKRGEQFRKIRETRMNTKSSRSHTVFRISLEEITENENGLIKKSYINMVDLAGSEKINKSEIISSEHLKELQNINQSLTTLGKVIHGLSHVKNKRLVIPYRESKLTRILQESLSGNSKTFVLGTLSPSFYNIQETISTLNFLERAQQIKTKVKQNNVVKSDQIIIQKLMKETQGIGQFKKNINKAKTPLQKHKERMLKFQRELVALESQFP
ncbi:P-loop containing nucleoside triphosphate hydrolase [Pseudocohnilembus persalinus]|uniref:p-loop containing nucleoside triphosphate hydrolase n=1 Tax=Pseudocohnilembus persalinus TaxID=266149 RepID=A0A0V0R2G6_PSEPJ|nr:P-loop containing nucleoside triphosphate hydrolase [Pseudocohnilembus persalinus]|eukprot:KRX08667.1 P-loop containing nucleoside triphosphate hydrolase [Pseudocohnilembus persalinus]